MGRILNFSDGANFAIHAMILVARSEDGRRLSAAELASMLEVSEAHLAKVLQQLKRQGFLQSKRGPGGGFVLAKAPEEITLYEILTSIDGPLDRDLCLLGRPLCIGRRCIMGNVLVDVHRIVYDHFTKTRLADLLERDIHGVG